MPPKSKKALKIEEFEPDEDIRNHMQMEIVETKTRDSNEIFRHRKARRYESSVVSSWWRQNPFDRRERS